MVYIWHRYFQHIFYPGLRKAATKAATEFSHKNVQRGILSFYLTPAKFPGKVRVAWPKSCEIL